MSQATTCITDTSQSSDSKADRHSDANIGYKKGYIHVYCYSHVVKSSKINEPDGSNEVNGIPLLISVY